MSVAEQGPLAGQFYIVTGGSRGIGAATAQRFAEAGALVGVTVTGPIGVSNANEALAPFGGFAHQFKFEAGLGDEVYENTVAAMVEEAENRFKGTVHEGGKVAIKGLVNNAGMTDNNNFVSLTADGWRNLFETNVIGPALFTKAAARYMRKVGASVTWVGSVAKFGHKGQASYAGSKAALEGISATVAIDLERWGVRSNVVRLGLVDTDMTRGDLTPEQFAEIEQQVPDGQAFTPEQAAEKIFEVATGDMNGEVIPFDGGLSESLTKV
ncbi:TPA: hypothetical protein DIS56_04335 [Candidatus Saccharibacteria bacterium]|nr:MAG: hypothetical protein A3F05_03455 [Candidatus Saccharibacteria bacterium RIFCSPHIGHO2_12_FULL_47_17]HCM52320.1 hypothetical protein [Candidatus Saccharibacteria bacterium]